MALSGYAPRIPRILPWRIHGSRFKVPLPQGLRLPESVPATQALYPGRPGLADGIGKLREDGIDGIGIDVRLQGGGG